MTCAKTASWSNPRILITLAFVFLCGASAGTLVTAMGGHRWWHQNFAPQRSQLDWKDASKERILPRLKKDLNLTPEQSTQIELVLDDFFTYYHTLHSELDDVQASGKERIMRILDDGQKRKFEKYLNELQEQHRH
jgi:hypothetical protein